MNKEQSIHVGMINSYNLLMERATFDEILTAGLGVFAHIPDEDIDYKNVELIILYFQELQMFEHCAHLKKYLEENYNKDGSFKVEECECYLPEIVQYTNKMKCANCNKRLR